MTPQQPIETTALARRTDTVNLGDGTVKVLEVLLWAGAAGLGLYALFRDSKPRRSYEPDAPALLAAEAQRIQRRNARRRRAR